MDRAARLLSGLILLSGLWAQAGYVEEGEASYYAASFEGLRTASGEKYSRTAYTAAHPNLPFGTHVKVTHLRTQRTTIVRINDRGPHKSRRIIDLSEAAAKELGILQEGVARVRIEVVDLPTKPPSPPLTSPYFDVEGRPVRTTGLFSVQAGAFTEIQNATALARNVQSELKGEQVFLWKAPAHRPSKEPLLYRVLIGSYRSRSDAEKVRSQLRQAGWHVFIVSLPHE